MSVRRGSRDETAALTTGPTDAAFPPGTPARLVAGVTVYRPDAPLLLSLLETLAQDDVPTLVHIDGSTGTAIDPDLLEALSGRRGLQILQARENVGVARGLNALAACAERAGAERILFFDQDSSPAPGLARDLGRHMDGLQAKGVAVAAVGPLPVPPAGEITKPPRYRRRAGPKVRGVLGPVDYIITSGSLVDLAAFRAVGHFLEDYRNDAIDIEWSFRAWHCGWEIHVARAVPMPHRIGSGIVGFGPLAFPRQDRKRMATYIRNQSHGMTLRHVPLVWKLRTAFYLPVQALVYISASPGKRELLLRFLGAARDGFRGRFGGAA